MAALDLRPVVPALIVAVTGLLVLLVQAFTPKGGRAPAAPLSLFGLAGALVALWLIPTATGCGACTPTTGGSVVADAFATFLQALILVVGIGVVLLSPSYLRAIGTDRGEYYTLVLFSIVGMLGLVSSVELISMFVALEIMSVALYALCGMRRDGVESQESAVKYFITGSFSSAFFLYGVALFYGVSGSTLLARIAPAVTHPPPGMELLPILGVGLIFVGFAFKVASVPFHAWAPDVYEGAPTTVTAFMAAGVKAAAMGALLRVLGQALPGLADQWRPALAALAVATMVLGNLGALAQRSVKRMLAYSSIAHAGYLLAALVAAREVAAEAVLFYLAAYAAVNLGGFGAMAALARGRRSARPAKSSIVIGSRPPRASAAMAPKPPRFTAA